MMFYKQNVYFLFNAIDKLTEDEVFERFGL